MLQRIRQAVREGNTAGSPPLPTRGQVGYQGAGADRLARLQSELQAAGGKFHRATDRVHAIEIIRALLLERNAQRILLGDGPLLDSLLLEEAFIGLDIRPIGDIAEATQRETYFAADVGISEADYVIAETGTIVQKTRRDQPRSVSLLPPVHIVVGDESCLVDDLFDLFVARVPGKEGEVPSCLTLITGPSKTGDIELKLVTGVHGPGEVHLVWLA
jgi:L-lactate utilization protein LutC